MSTIEVAARPHGTTSIHLREGMAGVFHTFPTSGPRAQDRPESQTLCLGSGNRFPKHSVCPFGFGNLWNLRLPLIFGFWVKKTLRVCLRARFKIKESKKLFLKLSSPKSSGIFRRSRRVPPP